MEQKMTLIELLEKSGEKVVTEAIEEMQRARLKHYHYGGPENTRNKMDTLYLQITQSVKEKNLIPIVSYIEKIAEARFESGFELQEVQTAINVLEEGIWKQILNELPQEDQPKALSLVSSIIGSGKDTLARAYMLMTKESKEPPPPPPAKQDNTD